jgi:hypothetical protein
MHNLSRSVATLALVLTACSHTQSPPVAAKAAPPAAAPAAPPIADLAKREATGLVPVTLQSADGKVRLTVEAKGQPTLAPIAKSEQYLLTVPIGSEGSIICSVGEAQDLAAVTLESRKGVEKFPKREISDIDAGELAGAAFLATRTVYVFERDGQKLMGEVKTAAARRGYELGAACVHDEVGYNQTLRRVLTSIMKSLTVAGDTTESLYREIAVIKIRGRSVGVVENRMVQLRADTMINMVTTSILVPVSPVDFQGTDSFESEISDDKGQVREETHLSADGNNDVKYKITIKRDAKGYHALGKFEGKPIDAELATEESLVSTQRQAQLTRELMAGKRHELLLWNYSPGSDPLGFSQARISASGDSQLPYRREDSDKTTMLMALDGNGNGQRGRIDIGPLSMEFTRVAEYGHFPQ